MVNIFISHKHEDEHTAKGLRDLLMQYDDDSDPKFKFFLSEDIIGGSDWYQWIKERLVESNLLLLLFTDVTKSWDWCLYEAGLFDRLDDNHHRRVICLHSTTTTPPDPLKNLQAFPATTDRLKVFLRQLYLGTELTNEEEPVAPWLEKVPDKLDEMATNIANLIDRRPVETTYFAKYVFLGVSEPETITPDTIPPDARVTTTEKSLEIFDKAKGEWVWQDLEQKARENKDSRWLGELAQAIYKANNGDIPEPVQAIFHARRGGKLYRPLLYRLDKLADGTRVFKVLFSEDVSWQLEYVPEWLKTLLTSLFMATRFRYELLSRYLNTNGKLRLEGTVEETCKAIRQSIVNIESEAASRGLLERQALIDVFEGGAEQDVVDQLFNDWYEVRQKLMNDLEKADRDSIEAHLSQLLEFNQSFMTIASRRYHQIVAASKDVPPGPAKAKPAQVHSS